jgi:hypothetical protein
VCPLKLDSLFEISHADLVSEEAKFPRFVSLSTHLLLITVVINFAVKIDVFGN